MARIHDILHKEKKVLVLRRNFFLRSLSRFETFFKLHRVVFYSLFAVLVVGTTFFVYAIISHANVATLNPSSCLGGWKNVTNAEGKPNLPDGADPNQFNETNSAVYEGGATSIFCGGFQGDMLDDSLVFTSARVHISLGIPKKKVDANSVPVSELEVLQVTSSSSEGVTTTITKDESGNLVETATSTPDGSPPPALQTPPPSEPQSLPPQTSPPTNVDTPPQDVPPPADAPVSSGTTGFVTPHKSLVNIFIPFAYAEDTTTPPAAPPDETSSTEINALQKAVDEPPPPESVASTSSDASSAILPLGIDSASTSTESVSDITTTNAEIPPLLSVDYTIDGTTWIPLGTINADAKNPVSFDIQNLKSIADVANLQIRIGGGLSADEVPSIYIDGITLEIAYEKARALSEEELNAFPKVHLEKSSVLHSDKKDYRADESPDFHLDLQAPEITNPSVEFPSSTDTASPPGEEASGTQSFLNSAHNAIRFLGGLPAKTVLAQAVTPRIMKAEVYDSGDHLTNIVPTFQQEKGGNVKIHIPNPGREFRPGKYHLDVQILSGGVLVNSTQNFSWGVLAVNFNKTVYMPGETAHMMFSVLTSNGDAICGHDGLEAVVVAPNGKVTVLSMANGKIKMNPACGDLSPAAPPDYEANLSVSTVGAYSVTVHSQPYNEADDGAGYTIQDTFVVDPNVPFSVERKGPTRIYPVNAYPMVLDITANVAFQGNIVEKVPGSFDVQYVSGGGTVADVGGEHEITWPVSMGINENKSVSYIFKAPMISPQFYLLGPAAFGSSFVEARQWQIAADAITNTECKWLGTTSNSWNTASNWNCNAVPNNSVCIGPTGTCYWVQINMTQNNPVLLGSAGNITVSALRVGVASSGSSFKIDGTGTLRLQNATASTAPSSFIRGTLEIGATTSASTASGTVILDPSVAQTCVTMEASSSIFLTNRTGLLTSTNGNCTIVASSSAGALTSNLGTSTGQWSFAFGMAGGGNVFNIASTSNVNMSGGTWYSSSVAAVTFGCLNPQIGSSTLFNVIASSSNITFANVGGCTIAGKMYIGTGKTITMGNGNTFIFSSSTGVPLAVNGGTFVAGAGTSTIIYTGTGQFTVASTSFSNLIISPVLAGTDATATTNGPVNVSSTLLINASSGTANVLTFLLGGNLAVSSTYPMTKTTTTTITRSGSPRSVFDTSGNSYTFRTGGLVVASGSIFNANGSNIVIEGSSSLPFALNGGTTFNAGTSTVYYTAGDTNAVNYATTTYFNLVGSTTPQKAGGVTHRVVGPTTVNGFLTFQTNPTSSADYNVKLGGNITILGTTTFQKFFGGGGGGGISGSPLTPPLVATTSRLVLNFGNFNAGSSTIIFTATSGIPLIIPTTTAAFNSQAGTIVFMGDGNITIATSTNGESSSTFNNVVFGPTLTQNRTYFGGTGPFNVSSSLTIEPQGTGNLTFDLGGTTNVASTTFITSSSTTASATLDTDPANSFMFGSGAIVLDFGNFLNANGSSIFVTSSASSGPLALPFVENGTFNIGTSSFTYNGDGDVRLATTTFYNLFILPTTTASRAYVSGGGSFNGSTTVNNLFTIDPGGATPGVTTTLSGNLLVLGTTTISAGGGNASTLGPNGSSSVNYTTRTLQIDAGASLIGSSSIITVQGTTTLPYIANGNFMGQNSTFIYNGDANLTIASSTYSTLQFSPTLSGTNRTYTTNGELNVSSTLTLIPAGTANNLTLTASGTIRVSATSTATGSGSATSTINTGGSSFAFLSGSLDIESGNSFIANGSTVSLSGSNLITLARPTTIYGTFSAGTSTLNLTSTLGAVELTASTTFYNVTIQPTSLVNNPTYQFATGTTITNNLVVDGSLGGAAKSLVFRTNGGAFSTTTIGASTTVFSSGAATATIKPTAGAFSMKNFEIGVGGIFQGTNGFSVEITGNSGVPLVNNGTLNGASSTFIFDGVGNITIASGTGYEAINLQPVLAGSNLTYTGGVITASTSILINPRGSANNLTFLLGGATTVSNGSTTIMGSGSATSSVDINPTGNFSLTSARINVMSGNALIGRGGAITLTENRINAVPFIQNGSFIYGTSTVFYQSNQDNITISSTTYYNLTLNPTLLTLGRSYVTDAAITVNGDFTMNPSGTVIKALSFTPVANVTVLGTTTITQSSAVSSTLLLTSGTHLFTTDRLTIANNSSSLVAGTWEINVTGASGVPFKENGIFVPQTGIFDYTGDGNITLATTTYSTLQFFPNLTANRTYTFDAGTTTMTNMYLVPLNTNSSILTVALGGTTTVSSFFVAGTSTLETTSSSFPLTAGEIALNNSKATFNARGSTITLTDAGDLFPLINGSGGTINAGTSTFIINGNVPLTVNATGTYYNLTLSPTLTANLAYQIATGTLSVGNNLDINPSGTQNTFTVNLNATTTVSATTTIESSGSASSTLLMKNFTFTTQDLAINTPSSSFQGSAAAITANGNVVIASGGTLKSTSGNFTIKGNYTNSGTFTNNGGTVTFGGTAQQYATGTMTGASAFQLLTIANNSGTNPDTNPAMIFWNSVAAGTSTITTGSTTVQFANGITSTFTNINWNGGATSSKVFVHGTTSTATWSLVVSGSQTVRYVDAKGSYACGGSNINASDGSSVDSGGNSCWTFGGTISITVTPTVTFSNLTPGTPVTVNASSSVTISGGTNGYQLVVKRDTLTSTLASSTITFPDATAWNAGTGCSAGQGNASLTPGAALAFRVLKTGTTGSYCGYWWGADDTAPNALYAGFPTSSVVIANSTSTNSGTDTIITTYQADAPTTQRATNYTGTVTYTAIANP